MPSPPLEAMEASDRAVEALRAYMRPFFAGDRQPTPGRLLSRLVRMVGQDAGFPADELIDNAIGLFPAGAETTTGLIGNAVSQLLAAPDLLAKVRRDETLTARVVDEALRFDSPINAAYRWAVERITLGSDSTRPGRVLILSLAGANRDPRAFDDPGRFDIRRRGRYPHVAFGVGRHVCLGAHLARLQAEVTIHCLLRRYDTIEIAGPPVRKRSVELRCLAQLPVQVVRH